MHPLRSGSRGRGQRCYLCSAELAAPLLARRHADWQVEHVIPFSANRARNDVFGNLLAACPDCNFKKGSLSLCAFVRVFGDNLDSRAALAPHLTEETRDVIIAARKVTLRTWPSMDALTLFSAGPSRVDF